MTASDHGLTEGTMHVSSEEIKNEEGTEEAQSAGETEDTFAVRPESKPAPYNIERYGPLGLVANPFPVKTEEGQLAAVSAEIFAGSNALTKAVDAAADEEKPKPLLLSKAQGIPDYYPMQAIARTEETLARSDEVNVLHAYVQMFMLRSGRVRATLRVLAERLAFRDFDRTLIALIESVLESPDTELPSYVALGPDRLSEFTERFESDRRRTALEYFGDLAMERREDLVGVVDVRTGDLEPDVDGEQDDAPEIDADVGVAPGLDEDEEIVVEASEEEQAIEAVVDYVIEHIRVHISPVVGRALRVYRERGVMAMSQEFRVTKAPRKTLAALARVALMSFRGVVIIYDGFGNWHATPPELRAKIAASLSEIRWTLDGLAQVVVSAERDRTEELEEQFSSGDRIDWDFPGLAPMEESPGEILPDVVDRWLEAACVLDVEPLTMAHPLLAKIAEETGGDLASFVQTAGLAIEDAADRKTALDEQAVEAALAANEEE